MKSTQGNHYIALDHIRAIAAFIVFTWHFLRAGDSILVPIDFTPSLYFFSFLDEGHTGVSLFMTLSGYLFLKILENKKIHYPAFIWNRILRLVPLLVFVIFIVFLLKLIKNKNIKEYLISIGQGFLLPTLPNGGWSITTEFHYYLILPFLLYFLNIRKYMLLYFLLIFVCIRICIYLINGEIQTMSYWTIIGRIDQFILGMLSFQLRNHIKSNHILAITTIVFFMIFYNWFNKLGGFYRMSSYPSDSAIWIYLPTLEGTVYGILIAWYSESFSHSHSGFSKFLGKIGEYSYSIYLLHFFVVLYIAKFTKIFLGITNFYWICLSSLLFFLMMLIPAYFSFKFIELPFLNLRKNYIIK